MIFHHPAKLQEWARFEPALAEAVAFQNIGRHTRNMRSQDKAGWGSRTRHTKRSLLFVVERVPFSPFEG